MAEAGGIRHVHIGHAPAGGCIDLADIALDPVAVAQRVFVRYRHYGHGARAAAIGIRAHGDFNCPA